jgi:serine-type D-Ala-D-Ala carboxypeptidase (penicillin-binding protein 5/6)
VGLQEVDHWVRKLMPMAAPRPPAAARLAALLASIAVLLSACTTVGAGSPAVRPAEGAVEATVSPAPRPALSPGKAADSQPPKVGAKSVFIQNLDTGTVLYAKGARARRPIASLTKIMTAMLVLGNTKQSEVVTASHRAAKQIPTKLGLKPGDRLEVHDLLYALMLHSSNDVAVALAEHVSGSVAAFDALMTAQAVDIGMGDTWFASPSGLNDKGFSTARDVAAMTRWAYESGRFADIVATKRYTVDMPSGEDVRLRNLNALLFDYPGAIGVKTGYTSESHWSLVAVATRGHTRILVVVLADPKVPFADGIKLLDWAFAREASLLGRVG